MLYAIEADCVQFFGSAMELALSLEKLTNEKLLNLHNVRVSVSLSLSIYICNFEFWFRSVNKAMVSLIRFYEIIG